jgi:hypothetical protein
MQSKNRNFNNLSLKARGLLSSMINLYNKEFEISREEILQIGLPDKEIATYNALKELELHKIITKSYIGKGKNRKLKIIIDF